MILILGGTKEGREIVELLVNMGKRVMVSVVSEYGCKLLADYEVDIQQGQLDLNGLRTLLKEHNIELVIDATHPFASKISENAIKATRVTGVDYLRYERPVIKIPENDLLIRVKDYREAARRAAAFPKILLTTGSNNLEQFINVIDEWQNKLVFRILPDCRHIKKLQKKGVSPKNIIALQGPFSKEMNQIILQDYQVKVLVTKASGRCGGLASKLEAAFSLRMPVILIERPDLAYPQTVKTYEQLVAKLNDRS